MGKLERNYQPTVIGKLCKRLPGCLVIKMTYPQGTPDLQVIYGRLWARLETKKSIHEPYQPNQQFYLEELNTMGFARMICPENEDQVLQDLVDYFADYGKRLECPYEY